MAARDDLMGMMAIQPHIANRLSFPDTMRRRFKRISLFLLNFGPGSSFRMLLQTAPISCTVGEYPRFHLPSRLVQARFTHYS